MIYGYTRVSTVHQGASGLGLQAQVDAILAVYPDAEIGEPEVRSGGKLLRRPVLRNILGGMEAGDILVVAKLDRLARNVSDFIAIADMAQTGGWRLVLLDLNLDTGRAMDRAMLTILAVFAELERSQNIGRTCDARDAQDPALGVRRVKIRDLHALGMSERAIAAQVGASRSTVTRELKRVR